VFATPGRHTFLIPINRGFEVIDLLFFIFFSRYLFWPVSHGSDARSSGKRHRDNARQTGARLRPSIKQPAADRLTSLDLLLHTVCSCKALFLVVIISCITVYCHCILFIFSPRPL
jgi:hypothetical protein